MKKILLTICLAFIIMGCDNSTSPSNGTTIYKEDNTFYGQTYTGVAGIFLYDGAKGPVFDTIAPVQLSYTIDAGIFKGSLKVGAYRSKWVGKIALPFGYFEGHPYELGHDFLAAEVSFAKGTSQSDSLAILMPNSTLSSYYPTDLTGNFFFRDSLMFYVKK
jgi:hypothetical protein